MTLECWWCFSLPFPVMGVWFKHFSNNYFNQQRGQKPAWGKTCCGTLLVRVMMQLFIMLQHVWNMFVTVASWETCLLLLSYVLFSFFSSLHFIARTTLKSLKNTFPVLGGNLWPSFQRWVSLFELNSTLSFNVKLVWKWCVFSFIFDENAGHSSYYLPARGERDLKSTCDPVEFDSEMRLKWGVIWHNNYHQSIPWHV